MSDYQAVTAVWETTMACNMRCMHCGSACAQALPDELSTEEAFALCDDLGKLGMQWITLSGGEPLTRQDWPQLARRLQQNGIITNMITNGWLLDDATVQEMRACDIGTVAISLDGVEKTHDAIRKAGSFARNMRSFDLMRRYGQYSGAITSVNKKNIKELPEIKNALVAHGVNSWQIQICIPMGNMVNHQDELIDPDEVDGILDFCLEVAKEKKITIYPADCLGYYTEKEKLIRMHSLGPASAGEWAGCNAGTRGFGILHNGDVLGCTSIRDRSFIEGNIRDKSIVDIWNGSDAFKWSRNMKKTDLGGECKTCTYGDVCLGGCPNTRLTMNKTMKSANPYCVYRTARLKLQEKIADYQDRDALFTTAQRFAQENSFQEAALILEHLVKEDSERIDALSLLGFTHFFMSNYEEAKEANERILAKEPDNSYANKGLGLSLHKMGQTEKGIRCLQKAIDTAPENFLDPYHDLAAVYMEIGQRDKAEALLQKLNSPSFA
ncbi:radical SAM protein [Candidatus Electrothrix sp.]|uniref:radical SAM protein n=1 Tax=Candidatus Electrothrix sp. TaxID=2170559 RepID=UPI0040575D65